MSILIGQGPWRPDRRKRNLNVKTHVPNTARPYLNKFFHEFPRFDIWITQHARERMREREIDLLQVRTVLRSGAVQLVEPDIKTGDDKYRVVGPRRGWTDLGGRGQSGRDRKGPCRPHHGNGVPEVLVVATGTGKGDIAAGDRQAQERKDRAEETGTDVVSGLL